MDYYSEYCKYTNDRGKVFKTTEAPACCRYRNIFNFGPDYLEFSRKNKSIAGYPGPCKAFGIHGDFDSEADLGASALVDIRDCIQRILSDDSYGVFQDDIRLWFSGNKGFSIIISTDEIRSLPMSYDTASTPGKIGKVEKIAAALFDRYLTWDTAVYDKTRIWRIPNSQHEKSGLFKIPLLVSEILEMPIPDIRELAKKQRTIKDAYKPALEKMKD
jgi:hypothetical protein